MLIWLQALLGHSDARSKNIPESLWLHTLALFPFLAERTPAEQTHLRGMVGQFLQQKEFTGAHGLVVSDEMAVAIAAQACLPVLHLGLQLYDDFKGIVVHPGAMLARREVTDDAGVVHRFSEVLAGEAMEKGPVTLSWQDVVASGALAYQGFNVVIHEFAHKIDMRDGLADGCPPQPSRATRAAWHAVMQPAYDNFCEQVVLAQRFGAPPPWLDTYGAESPAEFFAVTCEAYFVNRQRFTRDFAVLTPLFDQFFRQNQVKTQ